MLSVKLLILGKFDVKLPKPPLLAHNAVAWVPKQPLLVISAPTSPVIVLLSELVMELTSVKPVMLLSAPDASDPGLVIVVDARLASGVPDKDSPDKDIPVDALRADTVCNPL